MCPKQTYKIQGKRCAFGFKCVCVCVVVCVCAAPTTWKNPYKSHLSPKIVMCPILLAMTCAYVFCASHHHEWIWSIFIFAAYAGTEQNWSLTTRAKPKKEFVYTPIGVGAAAEQTALIPLIQCCTMFCRRCLSSKKKIVAKGDLLCILCSSRI